MTKVKFRENPIAFLRAVFKTKQEKQKEYLESYETKERSRMFESLKYWTPELIEWIGNTEDPIKLAVASCLVNCHDWPEWLPSKPEWYNDMHNIKDETYSAKLYFVCELHKICQDKSESISPKLCKKIWLTHYYRTYVD